MVTCDFCFNKVSDVKLILINEKNGTVICDECIDYGKKVIEYHRKEKENKEE